MKLVNIIIFISILTLSFGQLVGGYSSDYFDYGVGARSLSMGGTGRTVADDATSGYYSAALMPHISKVNYQYMTARILNETDYTHVGGVLPILGLNFAVNYIQLKMADLELHYASATPTSVADGFFSVNKTSRNSLF